MAEPGEPMPATRNSKVDRASSFVDESEAVDRMILLASQEPSGLPVETLIEVFAAKAAINAVDSPPGRLRTASRDWLRQWAARASEQEFVGLAEKALALGFRATKDSDARVAELRSKLLDLWSSFEKHRSDADAAHSAAKNVLRRELESTARLFEGDELIDFVAGLASRHAQLHGKASRLRVLLKLEASQPDIVRELAGGPHLTSWIADETIVAGEAVATIWQEEMLESAEISVALGGRPGNREKPRVLRERSELLGLPHGRGFVYPAFQVDPRRKDLRPEVREVNKLLDATADPWGVASWWVSGNDRLHGARPIDVVGRADAPSVVDAARAIVESE
jgi:hypothetical protein